MPVRHLPNDPDLDHLRGQAKSLLAACRSGDPDAVADFEEFHPRGVEPAEAKLADAQLVLARAYQQSSWPRLRVKVDLLRAIWNDDVQRVRDIVTEHPDLLAENVRNEDWGPPMSQAANLGRDEIVEMLASLGARDLERAFSRAALQGKVSTMRKLVALGATVPRGIIMGCCETVNGDGLRELVEVGAELCDSEGDRLAPVALALSTYSRNPAGKHEVLRILEANVEYPDTPAMAVHRGRVDLLEALYEREPGFVGRPLTGEEIFPRACGCGGDGYGLHGTPLQGATLLHMAIDYHEREIFDWLLDHGADPNARAAVDADGFGGHTPLFSAVVVQPATVRGLEADHFVRALLERGADPSVRASIRKQLMFIDDEEHEYREVTALEYGRAFHELRFVNMAALNLLQAQIEGG